MFYMLCFYNDFIKVLRKVQYLSFKVLRKKQFLPFQVLRKVQFLNIIGI